MAARNQQVRSTSDHIDEEQLSPPTRRDSGIRPAAGGEADPSGERTSGTRLVEKPATLPPPAPAVEDLVVARITLRPSVDEVLYRLSVGDDRGAFLASTDLERTVPWVVAPRVVLTAMRLSYLEEYILSFVDGASTWADILDCSPFSSAETLGALAALVDKGAVTLL